MCGTESTLPHPRTGNLLQEERLKICKKFRKNSKKGTMAACISKVMRLKDDIKRMISKRNNKYEAAVITGNDNLWFKYKC